MAKENMWLKIGTLAFLAGIVIALCFGLYQASTLETLYNEQQAYFEDPVNNPEPTTEIFFTTENGGAVVWVLAILGAIIGLLTVFGQSTITSKEVPGYLFAGIALVIMGGVFSNLPYAMTPWIGSLLAGVSISLSIFVAPTVGILAIFAIWNMGKDV